MKEIEEDKGIEEDKSSEGRLIKLSRYFFKKISDFFGKYREIGPLGRENEPVGVWDREAKWMPRSA